MLRRNRPTSSEIPNDVPSGWAVRPPFAYGTECSTGLFVAVRERSCAGTPGSSNWRRTHGAASALMAGASELADVIDTHQIVAISTSSAPSAMLDRSNIAGRAPRVKMLLAGGAHSARVSGRKNVLEAALSRSSCINGADRVLRARSSSAKGWIGRPWFRAHRAEVGGLRRGSSAGPVQTNRRNVGSLNGSIRARRRHGQLDVHEGRRHRTRTDGEPT